MKNGLNLKELYKIGAIAIAECILHDCEFYNWEIVDDESVRLSKITHDEDDMVINFEIWNGKEWKDTTVPYPFYKTENEELFLAVIEEIKNIIELKDFVEYY